MSDPQQNEHRMSFPLTEELAQQAIETITDIRRDPKEEGHASALIDLVLALTNSGLYEYFVRPLEEAKAGMMTLSTAKIGISTVKRGISMVVTKVIRGMTADQLRSIADSMESMLIRP